MGFEVDPEHLRTHGGAIEDAGTNSAGELNQLQQQTTGSPWGTGDTSANLGALYTELTTLTSEALGLLSQTIQDSGATLRTAAGKYDQTEQTTSSGFRRVEP